MAEAIPPARLTQMELDPKDRPRYTPSQLQTYFTRIQLPEPHRSSPILSDPSLALTQFHGLPFLHALTRYHTSHVPFENFELHYTAAKRITLDMTDLFDKFATQGLTAGRGGRCMENNGFFGTVLRSLGFRVRNCAGRVSRAMAPDPATRDRQHHSYDPWNHMLNLVRLDGAWWVVDVGMGAMGPNLPYPLRDGFETVSIAPRRIRLQLRSIPEHEHEGEDAEAGDEAQKLWCYDVCHRPKTAKTGTDEAEDEEETWIPTYCFTTLEFLPQDYEMMSWYTSTNPHSFFTYNVLCTKMLLSADEKEIVGDLTLFQDAVRRTVAGEREVVKEGMGEEERRTVLKDMFGVNVGKFGGES